MEKVHTKFFFKYLTANQLPNLGIDSETVLKPNLQNSNLKMLVWLNWKKKKRASCFELQSQTYKNMNKEWIMSCLPVIWAYYVVTEIMIWGENFHGNHLQNILLWCWAKFPQLLINMIQVVSNMFTVFSFPVANDVPAVHQHVISIFTITA
jgi:hypothetical protein